MTVLPEWSYHRIFCTTQKIKLCTSNQHHLKVLLKLKKFHLKGHTIGFCLQTQKLKDEKQGFLCYPDTHSMIPKRPNVFLFCFVRLFFSVFRDRKRKNFVGEDGNTKKIRTESGVRIPATYKKNMYPLHTSHMLIIFLIQIFFLLVQLFLLKPFCLFLRGPVFVVGSRRSVSAKGFRTCVCFNL